VRYIKEPPSGENMHPDDLQLFKKTEFPRRREVNQDSDLEIKV